MAKKKKWRKLLAVTLAASMVLGLANMSSLVAIAAGEGESTDPITDVVTQSGDVAQIGDATYATLDEAIERAQTGGTITLLADCTTAGLDLKEDITIESAQGQTYTVSFNDKGIALREAALTFKDCTVVMEGIGSTPYTEAWDWMTICASKNASLTLDHATMKMDGTGAGNADAIYFCGNNELNLINGACLTIQNYKMNALEWDGGDGGYNVNITDSTFVSDHNRSGFVGTFYVTIENSDVDVINSTGNGSNGSHYIITGSDVNFSGNGSHGLSAGDLQVTDSTITAENNGMCGVIFTGNGSFVNSDITITGTKGTSYWNAGMRLSKAKASATIDKDTKLTIEDNDVTGLFLDSNSSLTIEEGAKVLITRNHAEQKNCSEKMDAARQGGGIMVRSNAEANLSESTQIYNNHASLAGDDIYVEDSGEVTFGAVGSGWILDDCNDGIDGWYMDDTGARWSAHAKPVYAQKFTDFSAGAVKGVLAVKAAHGLTPLEPDDPDLPVWTTSKSKEATELDENYESDITLSLPASEEQLTSDVVFVLDKSTSAKVEEQMTDMLQELCAQAEETGASIKVGVVIFNKQAHNMLPLTELNSGNMAAIKAAIQTKISSGTNTHAGLLAGKAMLDADTSVEASRKYMVFVSDGLTYMFDENANTINSIQAGNGENGVMAGNDCWGIRHYQEGGDKFIPDSWPSYLSDVGAHLLDVDKYIKPYEEIDNSNHIPKGNTELPTTVDVALYKTSETYRAMQEEGYHCYALTAQTDAASKFPWGPAFMSYLSGGQEVSFADIQNDIYYLLSAGSKVVDVMGFGFDNADNIYNFDFVDDPERLTLMVGGVELEKTALVDPQYDHPNATSAYGFGTLEDENDQYDYVLYYYANGEDGQSEECIVWDINVPVSNFAPVQLTYTVKLMNPQTEPGEYGVYDADGSANENGLWTNLSATLYPVDSNGEAGLPENFRKPSVAYTVKDDSGDIEDPDGPDINNPDDPQEGGDTPDPNAPGGQDGDDTGNSGGEEDITDSDTPTTNSPNTGDTSVLCTVCAILMLVAFAGIVVMKRKCREE